jgi:hypothetical protein
MFAMQIFDTAYSYGYASSPQGIRHFDAYSYIYVMLIHMHRLLSVWWRMLLRLY